MRKTIQVVCGLSVVVAFVFSSLSALSFVNRLTIWRDLDQYKPESFIVTGAEYHADAGVPDEGGDVTYWLDGIVAGTPERLIPNRNGSPQPRNADDLERQYPKGTKINVLYNPTAERTIVQDETLRVKEAIPDFWDREARLRLKLGDPPHERPSQRDSHFARPPCPPIPCRRAQGPL